MSLMKGNRKIVLVLLSLFLLAVLPTMASAQGRGRGRAHDKKWSKFVNGHDARDGRWDGRGSRYGRRVVVGNVIVRQRHNDRFRSRRFERNEGYRRFELRRRNSDNDNFLRSQRQRHRHRFVNRYRYVNRQRHVIRRGDVVY